MWIIFRLGGFNFFPHFISSNVIWRPQSILIIHPSNFFTQELKSHKTNRRHGWVPSARPTWLCWLNKQRWAQQKAHYTGTQCGSFPASCTFQSPQADQILWFLYKVKIKGKSNEFHYTVNEKEVNCYCLLKHTLVKSTSQGQLLGRSLVLKQSSVFIWRIHKSYHFYHSIAYPEYGRTQAELNWEPGGTHSSLWSVETCTRDKN